MEYRGPELSFDVERFEPMRVLELRHGLAEHPLLQFPRLALLAERLARASSVRAHDARTLPSTSFATAQETHPARLTPAESVRKIEEAQAWLSLLNVQRDPEYRALVDEVLDHVRPRVERRDPGMHHRAGWIFIASPGAVTPFHFDHENNFILQILGRKRVYVWDPLDEQVVTERALELFHGGLSRDALVWREEHLSRAYAFDFEPGVGAYMPQTAPHMVRNGDGPSITLSVTYYTSLTRRRQALYRANHWLRRHGLEPRPVNRVAPGEPVKHALWRGFRACRRGLAQLQGKRTEAQRATYSEHDLADVVY